MSEAAIYPWQTSTWQRLATAKNKLPHALLLKGAAGIGKDVFAVQLAKSLLCRNPQHDAVPCGACPSCMWFDQESHPDYRRLSPEQDTASDEETTVSARQTGKKTQISVTQVRDLSDFLGLSSHADGGLRIVLITPAEALNPASANALLKMLEEPPAGVVFILVTHQPQRLLPTILSRCQQIAMPIPDKEQALAWLREQGIDHADEQLAYAGGSPLAAQLAAEETDARVKPVLQMLTKGAQADAFIIAPALAGLGMPLAVKALQKWVYDILAYRFVQQARYHIAYTGALQELAKSVDLGKLLEYQRKLNEAFRSATHPLNQELQLESLLLQYTQLFSVKTRP